MTRSRWLFIAAASGLLLIGALAYEIVSTQPIRGAVRALTELQSLANRETVQAPSGPVSMPSVLGDVEPARVEELRSRCSTRYLRTHGIELAAEGGIVGIPRTLHTNFRAWRQGSNVWICPTNRIGFVYQFVLEGGRWRFDGLVGQLLPWGELVRISDTAEPDPGT